MEWSTQQDAALLTVKEWLVGDAKRGKQVCRVFGFAGTGKSTLAQHFAEYVDGPVQFCSYTGKAAQVMREKGCQNACTIHSLIYQPREKSQLKLKMLEAKLLTLKPGKEMQELLEEVRREREALAQPAFTLNTDSEFTRASLGIVDECSMVDSRVGQDLLSFNIPILVLGDPAQLPPVRGSGFFTDQDPDVMLTEIHRQARENPIIQMATEVREGNKLEAGNYGESEVITTRPDPDRTLAADQVLCGRNVTRRSGNHRCRELHGFEHAHPEPGDRLVCLRNNYEDGLLNGTLWNCQDVGDVGLEHITMTVKPVDGGAELTTSAHLALFRGEELGGWMRREANEFDFGYFLTVHKAQGSQWKDVVLFDESYCFRADSSRWLYTGITRASEKITVVKRR